MSLNQFKSFVNIHWGFFGHTQGYQYFSYLISVAPLFLIHSLKSGFPLCCCTKTAHMKVTNTCPTVKSNGQFSGLTWSYQQHLIQLCSLFSLIIFFFFCFLSKVLCSLAFPPTSQVNFSVSFTGPSSSPQTCNVIVPLELSSWFFCLLHPCSSFWPYHPESWL